MEGTKEIGRLPSPVANTEAPSQQPLVGPRCQYADAAKAAHESSIPPQHLVSLMRGRVRK
jgi:hypothetical protein